MDVEILTIGDELLLGQTVDTNSAFIAARLSDIGLIPRYKSSAGDGVEEIENAIKLAVNRASLVITSGGLGPTDDDNTKKAIVKVFQRKLVLDENLLEDIRLRYKKRGIEMPAVNENQALIPSATHIFRNKIGSAVGIGIIERNSIFVALPGVPTEMRQMVDLEVIPFLKNRKLSQPVKAITIRTNGLFESQMHEIIAPDLELDQGVKLAYLPGLSGVDLRIVATGTGEAEVNVKAKKVASYIEKMVGKYIYGYNDDTLPSVVGKLLKENGKTIATAESCTGGMLGKMITMIPGSSEYFLGGVVAYANAFKESMLNVSRSTIEKYGAVSGQCAVEMAVNCRQRFKSDYALSITGIAGPDGGTIEKPVGTTFIGLSTAQNSYAKQFNFGVEREMIRARASYTALEMIRREILGMP